MSKQNKVTLQVLAFVFILICIGAGVGKLMFLDEHIAGMNKKIKATETSIKEREAEMKTLTDLENRREEIEAIRAKVEKQAERLPSADEIPNLILIIKRMLMLTSVRVNSASQEKSETRQFYREIPYKLTCRSGYHNFGQFLNLIEVNPDRLMRIKKLEIELNEKNPTLHNVDMTIAAYVTRKRK